MLTRPTSAVAWPADPFKGLDFYTAADSILFRERDDDAIQCLDLLARYRTKILILHGPSGSGKSSFLRAGLIPALKAGGAHHRPFFVNSEDGVIRSTGDPVRAIVAALSDALMYPAITEPRAETKERFPGARETFDRPAAGTRLRGLLASAPIAQIVSNLLDVMTKIRTYGLGSLVLVIDQAEEVLTHPSSSNEAANAFFRLIEEIYFRNLDLQIILSLRTEYYGRFRNELRISDRLEDKPADAGLEQYFLGPLRDPNSLRNVIAWPQENNEHDYGFEFQPSLIDQMIRDVLASYPASVTPALQIACQTLVGRRLPGTRWIRGVDYTWLGGLDGIIDAHIDCAIGSATKRTTRGKIGKWLRVKASRLLSPRTRTAVRSSTNRIRQVRGRQNEDWRALLANLVSEQGGGLVVAVPRSEAELAVLAAAKRLRRDIRPTLEALATGTRALLRRIDQFDDKETKDPTSGSAIYILRHDTLAISLSRWKVAQSVVRRERHIRRLLAATFAAIILVGFGASVFRGRELVKSRDTIIALKNTYAERAPTGDYRKSLLLLLANAIQAERAVDFYDRIFSSGIRESTLRSLRRTLPNVPWHAGRFDAVGISAGGEQIAVLDEEKSKLMILDLSAGPEVQIEPKQRILIVPIVPFSSVGPPPNVAPAVGFVKELGPVLVTKGRMVYWDNDDKHSAEGGLPHCLECPFN